MAPKIGDIANAKEIGKTGTSKYLYSVCPSCGEERWAFKKPYENSTRRLCRKCSIEQSRRGFKIGPDDYKRPVDT